MSATALQPASVDLLALIEKATVRLEILMARMEACNACPRAHGHTLSLFEIPGWIEEQREASKVLRLQTDDAVARGVDAAWFATFAPGTPSVPAPTEAENPLFWCQVRAAVLASGARAPRLDPAPTEWPDPPPPTPEMVDDSRLYPGATLGDRRPSGEPPQ